MRVQNIALLAVAVAAGLSLTACGSSDNSSSSGGGSSSPSATASDSSGGQGSASQGSGGTGGSTGSTGSSGRSGGKSGTVHGPTGSGRASGAGCTTAHLSFSTSGGMAEGTLVVNLKNTGSVTCSLKGFPGADLKSKDGTVSARRSKLAAPLVSVKPGEEARFTLHYPPNNSGGSGETFTSLVVTPPNETHSRTLPVSINVPVSDGNGPAVTVDPVGTGK